jgi:hypothetical protein
MTYEQAGGGVAGLGIENNENTILTLKDRIEHHYTTGISTVEIASLNKDLLNKNYQEFYSNENLKYQNYVMQGHQDILEELSSLLGKHDIKSYQLEKKTNIKGFNYQTQKKHDQTRANLEAQQQSSNTNWKQGEHWIAVVSNDNMHNAMPSVTPGTLVKYAQKKGLPLFRMISQIAPPTKRISN